MPVTPPAGMAIKTKHRRGNPWMRQHDISSEPTGTSSVSSRTHRRHCQTRMPLHLLRPMIWWIRHFPESESNELDCGETLQPL